MRALYTLRAANGGISTSEGDLGSRFTSVVAPVSQK
jgi:hypothetical protein